MVMTAAAILAVASPARAQEKEEQPARTEETKEQPLQEVFQSEVVYTQEKGEVQITVSPTFGKGGGGRLLQTPLSLEYGVTDKWQVELEWQPASFRREAGDEGTARGTGDLRFGTKYSFMNVRGSSFHSAVGLEVGLPTGSADKGLSEGFVEYEPCFILARDFPKLKGAQLFTQVGVGLLQRPKGRASEDGDEPAAHEFNLNVGGFIPVRHVVLTGELNWQTNRWNHGGQESSLYFTPGLVWHPTRSWEVGVGVPIGLTRGADGFRNIVKFTYEF